VKVICPSDSLGYLANSRYISKRPPGVKPLAEFSSLRDYLEGTDLPGAVLIPCSDHWVREVAALPQSLSERFCSSSPSKDIVAILLSKAKLAAFLKLNGIAAPLTLILESEGDIAQWPEERFENSFLKPCDSQRFMACFRKKAFRVLSREETVGLYRQTAAKGIDMVLQEYVPGPGSEHYFIEGFIDSGGKLRGLFARRRLRMYPVDFGDSTYSRTVPLTIFGDLGERLYTVLLSLRYRGIFSAEFKHDCRDGQFKLLEINTRVWWQFGIAMDSGMNFAAMAYQDALGQPVEPVDSYPLGIGWVATGSDKKAGWALYRRGELSLGSWLWSWLTSTKELFRWDDPYPYLGQLRYRITSLPRKIFE
jgi:D-aspartate ligase